MQKVILVVIAIFLSGCGERSVHWDDGDFESFGYSATWKAVVENKDGERKSVLSFTLYADGMTSKEDPNKRLNWLIKTDPNLLDVVLDKDFVRITLDDKKVGEGIFIHGGKGKESDGLDYWIPYSSMDSVTRDQYDLFMKKLPLNKGNKVYLNGVLRKLLMGIKVHGEYKLDYKY